MISLDLARLLDSAGVRWRPATGDRFTLRDGELNGQVFVVSDMVVEAREYSSGTVLAFNGTTEWALDSVQVEQAVWLPSEGQLRDLLGGTFRALEHRPQGDDAWVVRTTAGEHGASSAADAYARAALSLIERATAPI